MSTEQGNKEKEDLKQYWKDKKAAKKAKRSAKAWYKKPGFIVLWAILALFVLVGIFGSSNDSSTKNPQQQTKQTTEQSQASNKADSQMASVGDKVRDGKFEFVVKSIKCGEKSVGGEYVNSKAQGQFCRVTLSIKNIGDEPQTLFSSDQYAYDTVEKKYSADDEATIYASNDGGSTWYEEINPGNTVKGDILFDVPKTVKLKYLELHDSAFSNGVKVEL